MSDPPSAAELCGSVVPKPLHGGTFHPARQPAPKSTPGRQYDVAGTRTDAMCLTVTLLLLLLTICTVWLNSSRSAVMELIWSMRRCFLEKKRSRRVLSERQDATLDLYSSLSLFTTDATGKKKVCKTRRNKKDRKPLKWTVPCLTVADGYSLPCLTRSIAVVNADDRSSALFR